MGGDSAVPRPESPLTVPEQARPALIVVATAFEAVERVRRALGTEFRLLRCATVGEAHAALARGERIAGALLEPRDARGEPTAPLLRVIRAAGEGSGVRSGASAGPVSGSVPVIALVRRSGAWCAATVALLEAHPTLVLVAEDLDLDSVTRVLATRLSRAAFVRDVWGVLEPDVPVGLRPLVRVALARADESLTVEAIARELGLHRKTLWSLCRRHGLGGVQALMTWCRLLAVEHALRHCSRPVDAIAEELAFASPTALRNAVRRYLRTTPTALRAANEADSVACGEFRAWMRGSRAPPAKPMGDVA